MCLLQYSNEFVLARSVVCVCVYVYVHTNA